MSDLPQTSSPRTAERTSLLISEASKMYCDLLTKAFLTVPERFEVVACASKTTELLALVQEHRPKWRCQRYAGRRALTGFTDFVGHQAHERGFANLGGDGFDRSGTGDGGISIRC